MYEYSSATHPFSEPLVGELHLVAASIFESIDRTGLDWKLSKMPDVTVQVARAGQVMVGFKIGYALARTRYYSWLGGVHPEHRRKGIARRLTEMQHERARSMGFASVETGLLPTNSAMLSLNLRAGFHVNGMYSRANEPRLTMLRRF